ncbi:DUF676-domain-containing protein [Cubamyces lactineus]|nr:DUF676-domain-containing protein [Cubamyces lactineus]
MSSEDNVDGDASPSTSATTGTASGPVHLLVLIHGMWGNPGHLAQMRRVIEERRGQAASGKGPGGEVLHVLVPETNKEDGTYDGIDWGGERVAEEVYAEIKKLEQEGRKVTRFSVTGYSLGGLIARYLVGILHQRGFFTSVTPVNFNTVATPHIGLPRYPTVLSFLFAFFGPKLLSRTGEQFYVVDKWSKNGRPLLEVMADPNRLFYQALTLFEHVRIYANAVNDVTVPYPTAAIELGDIFINHVQDGIKIEFDEEYSPIIKSYTIPESTARPPKPRAFSAQWFKELKPGRPLLPPALQFSFPYNVLIYVLTPVLVPLFLSLVLTRLSLASHASRSRIKQLEKEETGTERLVHVFATLEREVEDAVVDMFDNSDGPSPSASDRTLSSPSSNSSSSPDAKELAVTGKGVSPTRKERQSGLVLNETQRKLVRWLNTLPGLKKELAFIHPLRNAHGTIIARDVQRFPAHKIGEGVLRHWADHFIL